MPTILVSGDSWTSCWPLEERLGHRNFGWPNLVASDLNYQLMDKSRAGSSNYRIYRKAFDGLIQHQPEVVMVFLTSWTRMETGSGYGSKPGRIYQHLACDNSAESEYVFKNFFNGYKNYCDMLRMIISLQNLATNYSSICYFLDTFDNNLLFDITKDDFKTILSYNHNIFNNMDDERIDDKFNKVKRLTSQINQNLFVSLESYQSLIQDCSFDQGHPLQDGHSKIADITTKFLRENNHGKTI
jgi:hypothetical protein